MASGQNGPYESGGSPAASPNGAGATSWYANGPQTEGSDSRKIDGEAYASGIPGVLGEDSDSDRLHSGFEYSGPNAPTKPGSPGGVPGEITNLSFDPNAVLNPAPTRIGQKRQQYSQAPNKG